MLKRIALILALIGCLLLFWAKSEQRYLALVTPPSAATNLNSFLRIRPNVTKIEKITRGSSNYIVVLGNAPRPGLSLPSGPPVYVFDATGSMVDWVADLGEASAFNNKWGYLSNAIPITSEETNALFKGGAP
jgi:hypothetical protein